jgi:energy-coupling factor transporter transmembrane protein EcfT
MDLKNLRTRLSGLYAQQSCTPWCWPLIIYIIIVAISFIVILVSKKDKSMKENGLLWNILWAILFGLILYWLCSNCQNGWAWFLLLLPLIVLGVIMAIFIMGYSLGAGFSQGSKAGNMMLM